jgi:hypothetical protein
MPDQQTPEQVIAPFIADLLGFPADGFQGPDALRYSKPIANALRSAGYLLQPGQVERCPKAANGEHVFVRRMIGRKAQPPKCGYCGAGKPADEPAAETATEYGVKLTHPQTGSVDMWTLSELTEKSSAESAAYDYERDGFGVVEMQRSVYFGPWMPVTEESNEGDSNG